MPVPVRGSRTLECPLWLLAVLDESGSTASSDPKRQSHQALLELCEWVETYSGNADDRIGLVRFADRAETMAPLVAAKAREAFEAELLAPADVGGGTRLTPAVDAVCTRLPRRGPHRVVVLITDGQVAEADAQLRVLFGRLHARSEAVHLVALDHDGFWSRSTHARYEQLGLSSTVAIGALTRAQLAHTLARLLMAETGLVARGSWRRRRR